MTTSNTPSTFSAPQAPQASETEQLKRAAAAVDRFMEQGGIVEIDPELADFMGIIEDDDFPEDAATEATLFPHGRPHSKDAEGGGA